ncbi:heme o synthase [Thiomicrorhabdus sp. Milos-T2]|uniref:heme o synthase n=1 Tax=Thiomicrorhabdus sp. Milos-T2 TaxID=90814 RepID=UPI000A96BF98|nr:heme o synthase [Thiomicrorhabdus sp. Milos-T2]
MASRIHSHDSPSNAHPLDTEKLESNNETIENSLEMEEQNLSKNQEVISRIRAVYELGKPKVVYLIMFTAVVGMILALSEPLTLQNVVQMAWATLGIGLVSASGAAVNHIIDHKVDEKMARTEGRPLPTGRVSILFAIFVAITWLVSGEAILLWQTNFLTALLTLISMFGYAFVYTVFLKHTTPMNIVWGGAAGAMPPLLGWVAMTGQVSIEAIVLFLIIFLWTPPHFWPLAIYRVEEYRKTPYPMLPVTHGIPYTKNRIVFYTVLMFLITLLPAFIGMSGLAYFLSALGLNVLFAFYVYRLYFNQDAKADIKLFAYSIIYLMLIFASLLGDHFIDHQPKLPNLLPISQSVASNDVQPPFVLVKHLG